MKFTGNKKAFLRTLFKQMSKSQILVRTGHHMFYS